MAPRGPRTIIGEHEQEARAALDAAQVRVEQVKRSVARGKVSGTDLMTARAELEAAELKVGTARERDRAARRKANDAEVDQIITDAGNYDPPDFAALVREVHTAAQALAGVVTEHNRSVRTFRARLDATGSTSSVVGGADTPAIRFETLTGLLKGVFAIDTADDGKVTAISVKDPDGDRVEQLAMVRPSRKPLDLTDGGVVEPRPTSDSYAAERAAVLRYREKRDEPFEANRPELRYPGWIHDADLVALVKDVWALNPDPLVSTGQAYGPVPSGADRVPNEPIRIGRT